MHLSACHSHSEKMVHYTLRHNTFYTILQSAQLSAACMAVS